MKVEDNSEEEDPLGGNSSRNQKFILNDDSKSDMQQLTQQLDETKQEQPEDNHESDIQEPENKKEDEVSPAKQESPVQKEQNLESSPPIETPKEPAAEQEGSKTEPQKI